MVPSILVTLDSLPLTPTRKVDRKALPEHDKTDRHSGAPFVAPRSPIERQLTDVWCEILRMERVGIHDNFFDLVGHSLSATQVITRLQAMFDLELSPATFVENPTVASLAEAIEIIQWVRQGQRSSGDTDDREEGDL